MKKYLYIIFDTSGSMDEMAKIHIQKNLCRFISQIQEFDQEKYANLEISFFKWTQDISKINIEDDGKILALEAESVADLSALGDFIIQHQTNLQNTGFLILSDANFLLEEIKSYSKKIQEFSNLIVRCVAIGADADSFKLKELSTNASFYLAENIFAAIDNVIFTSNEDLAEPVFSSQISQEEIAIQEDDWDA